MWCIAIYQFSAQNCTESNLLSQTVYQLLPKSLTWIFQFISIRKMAHIIEYLILSVLTLLSLNMIMNYSYFWTLLLCYSYACMDEFHQSFIAGRGGKFTDTLIDLIGISIGLCIGFIIVKIINRICDTERVEIRKGTYYEKNQNLARPI